jgi:hypothetical protein
MKQMPRNNVGTNEASPLTITTENQQISKGLHRLFLRARSRLPHSFIFRLMLLFATLGIFAAIFSQILQRDCMINLTFDQGIMNPTIVGTGLSTTTMNPILDLDGRNSPASSEGQCDASLELELPDLDPLTSSSIAIPIEHNDMNESTSVLLSGEPQGNDTLVQQIEQFDGGEDSSESDYVLLKRVTTSVGDYDPLDHERPERFIPVLEALGINDNDKDEDGHRRDSFPIAYAVDKYGDVKSYSAIFQFLEESENDNRMAVKSNRALKNFLQSNAQGIIVRNNPGTLSATSQKKFDDMLRELSDAGLMIMTHPDVMSTLGAKDVS